MAYPESYYKSPLYALIGDEERQIWWEQANKYGCMRCANLSDKGCEKKQTPGPRGFCNLFRMMK